MFPFPRVPSVPSIPQHGSHVSLASNHSQSFASTHSKTVVNAVHIGQKRLRTMSDPPLRPQDARRRERAFHYDSIHDDNQSNGDSRSLTSQLSWRNSPKLGAIAERPVRSVSGNIADGIEGSLNMQHPSAPRLHALRHVVIPEIGGNDKACENEIELPSVTPESKLLERAKLKGMVDAIYKDFASIDEEGIRELKEVVYENLLRMEISPDELKSTLNDLQNADYRLSITRGILSALGFIVGGRVRGVVNPMLKPLLPGFLLALMPGLLVAGADRLLTSFLHDANPGYFTAPNPDLLESAMQKCLQHFERPLSKEMLVQTGALFFPYSLRNVGGSLLSPFVSPEYLQLFSDVFALPAGGHVQHQRDSSNKDDLLMHSAYFLGRKDWIQRWQEFRSPTHQKFTRLINRVWNGSAYIPTMLGNAFSRLFTVDSATEALLLAYGFAGVEYATAKVGEYFKDSSDPARKYAASTTGTASLMALYILLGAAMTCSGRMTQRLARLQPCPEAPAAPSPISIRSLNNVQRH